jgi:hypothetical protein
MLAEQPYISNEILKDKDIESLDEVLKDVNDIKRYLIKIEREAKSEIEKRTKQGGGMLGTTGGGTDLSETAIKKIKEMAISLDHIAGSLWN